MTQECFVHCYSQRGAWRAILNLTAKEHSVSPNQEWSPSFRALSITSTDWTGTVWDCSTSHCIGAEQKISVFEYHCKFLLPGATSIFGEHLGKHPSWGKSSFFLATRMTGTYGNLANFSCPSSDHRTTSTKHNPQTKRQINETGKTKTDWYWKKTGSLLLLSTALI